MVGSVYTCGSGCACSIVTSLAGKCLIEGGEAAEAFGYVTQNWLSYVCSRAWVG